MSTSSKTTTAPEPPAQAVAQDAHWAAKQAKLKARQNLTAPLRICDDADLKVALADAKRAQRLAAADLEVQDTSDGKAAAKKRLAAADKALAAAQEAVDAETVTLWFRGLPRTAYEALLKAHPPTEQQAEDGDPWNTDTFAPALVAASSLDGMPLEDAEHFLNEWSAAEAQALFNAAQSVQQTSRLELGKG